MNGEAKRCSFCVGCLYHGIQIDSCDYIFIEGHSRGCPPGDGCTKRVERLGRPNPLSMVKRHYRKKTVSAAGVQPDNGTQETKAQTVRVSKIPPSVHLERLRLYEQGCNDVQIAKATGCAKNTVFLWRKANSLPAQKGIAQERHSDRMQLYQQGLTDVQIAEIEGCSANTICIWRNKNGLPRGELSVRMRLYEQGLNDLQIAEATGYTQNAIQLWRKKNNLPAVKRRKQSKGGSHENYKPIAATGQ